MPRLTDKSIKAAGEGIIWDDLTRGLGIRVGKTKKTFVVLVDSGRRKSIGHYPTLSLADARKIAKEMLAEKMLGKVRPKHVAFDDAKADFLTECALKNRASTVSDYTKILRKHYPFGRKGVGDITPRDILGQLAVLNDKPTRKRYAFAVGRVFFNWCIKQHIIDFNNAQRVHVNISRRIAFGQVADLAVYPASIAAEIKRSWRKTHVHFIPGQFLCH